MKAVLVTDVFQSLLMFAAVAAVLTRGVMDFGVSRIFSIASEGGRLEFFKYVNIHLNQLPYNICVFYRKV